jgi:hypothetical protein
MIIFLIVIGDIARFGQNPAFSLVKTFDLEMGSDVLKSSISERRFSFQSERVLRMENRFLVRNAPPATGGRRSAVLPKYDDAIRACTVERAKVIDSLGRRGS